MQLVYEKEKRLRMMMKMHGLGDSAYWLVTYVWFLALYCVYVFIFMLFGSLIGLNMFRKNSYGKRKLIWPLVMPWACVMVPEHRCIEAKNFFLYFCLFCFILLFTFSNTENIPWF